MCASLRTSTRSEYWPFQVAWFSDQSMACAMSLVHTSKVGVIAWLPLMKSVFLRWRVASVPTTFDGRVSTSKPAGVRASPL